MVRCAWFLVLVLASMAVANDAELASRLQPLIEAHAGDVSVAVKHLPSGRGFAYRSHEPMPTASLIKLPVMVEAYRQAAEGRIDLEKRLSLSAEDKVPGSGILTVHFSPGASLTLRDAIRLMIAFSDNTATNFVIGEIGLPSTSAHMEQLGLPNTDLHAQVFRASTSIAPDRSKRWGLGSTTAAEMLLLLEKLHRKELVSPAACQEMLAHLEKCEDKARFPRFLPPGTKVAHKTGAVSAVRTDAGLIESPAGTIALCVLTANNQDQRWIDDAAGNRLCAEIAREVFTLFNPDTPRAPANPTELKVGDAGELVMALQRTLNARLKPSPELGIDGEFGPVTEAAVQRFQRDQKLDVTGLVATATWRALGPLVMADAPVADPDVVNAQVLEIKPADSLDGPPFTTAKAWAIADGKTGKVLWEHQGSDRLEMASTTKMMTAYIALKRAEKDPAVLDLPMVVSEKADRTPGSSAEIRAGDQFKLGDLLYGLLLPSGNDAAVAIAETLGAQCESDDDAQEPLERFIAEMNRQAETLGLKETRYVNPHGLPAREHVSSARDLATLAWTASQLPKFRETTTTRQRGLRVENQNGQQRNLVWKNTNELLEVAGYTGVKTGTTRSAGACLVSSCQRGEDQLIVVVLGCPTSECRYVDTRNLYRWAWSQRAR